MKIKLRITALCLLLSACAHNGQDGSVSDAAGDHKDGGDGNSGSFDCDVRILEGEVTNARELGGVDLDSGRAVLCRRIMRGGDLTKLTDDGCSEFSNLGIRTVLDLRMENVFQDEPAAGCVGDQATVVNVPMPKLLPDTTDNYIALFNETGSIKNLFNVLGDADAYPVYVHCVIGRDRASFATALILKALGADRKTVIEEFRLSAEAGVAVKEECIEAVLDEIDDRGGIEKTLKDMGVTEAQLNTLREKASAGK